MPRRPSQQPVRTNPAKVNPAKTNPAKTNPANAKSTKAQSMKARPVKPRPAKQAATTPGRKNMKAAERERVILDTAIRFFAEQGFEGQTRELAKRIGITHSAIYRHFSSKDALIERVYEHVYVSRWNPSWTGLVTDPSRPLEDRLVQFYHEYAARIFDYDWVRIFVFSGFRSYNITGRYLAMVRKKLVVPVCRELRKELQRRHGIAPPGPRLTEREEEAVWGLHGQIFYIAIRRYVYDMPEPSDLDQVIADHVRRFVRGALAQP